MCTEVLLVGVFGDVLGIAPWDLVRVELLLIFGFGYFL